MRFLFVAYCMSVSQGQAQIGVYKRGLRLALELVRRGHEVNFFCTGRDNYHDSVTELAEQKLTFVEFPFLPAMHEGARYNRANFLAALQTMQPDRVVIGEAPMAGTLLETTLCAVELGIPTVCLDNAYQPIFVDFFCQRHGAMFDGIILNGPSALHGPSRYPALAQVPPYIEPSPVEAQALLCDELGLRGGRLLIVLAYDPKVRRLGLSLLERIRLPDVEAIFVCPAVDEMRAQLSELPPGIAERARAISVPGDGLLFGLLQLARCAVTKCAYMQVTESLSLHTPVIGIYYPGYFSFDHLPDVFGKFTHAVTQPEADDITLSAAHRFLTMDPDELRLVHDGGLGAAARAARFLEQLPPVPRRGTEKESAQLGLSPGSLSAALKKLEPRGRPALEQVRSMILRSFPDHDLYTVMCAYRLNGSRRWARLWARLFNTPVGQVAEARRAQQPDTQRQVLYSSARHRMLIELDIGEEILPSINELQNFQN